MWAAIEGGEEAQGFQFRRTPLNPRPLFLPGTDLLALRGRAPVALRAERPVQGAPERAGGAARADGRAALHVPPRGSAHYFWRAAR